MENIVLIITKWNYCVYAIFYQILA